MKVTVIKHFSPMTPFGEASNDEELAKITRLKYPQACSGLRVNAGFFARTVEEIREFEAWRVIGFSSFEDFCRVELGKTIDEVESIVSGVKHLTEAGHDAESISEEVAKKASRSATAAQMVKAGTHTQAQAAREVGISEPAVHKELTKTEVTNKKVKKPPQPTIKLADPTRTADNIRAKMGEEYAARLKEAL
jgi:hypothetical protein